MNRSILNVVSIFTIVILLCAASYTGYALYQESQENIRSAKQTLPKIGAYAVRIVASPVPPERIDLFNLKLLLMKNPALKSLLIYDKDATVLYAYAREPEYIQLPTHINIKRSQVVLPNRKYLDTSVKHTISSAGTYYSEGVFSVFPSETALVFGKYFFFLLCFLFLLLFLFVILSRNSRRGGVMVENRLSESQTVSPHMEDKMYKDDSMLCFEEYLPERLENELRRAASFDQDLSVALIECQTSADRANFIHLSDEVRDFFHFHDLLFEYQGRIVAVILPNTDIDEGLVQLSDFQKSLYRDSSSCDFETAIGLSSRNGRLISNDRILSEAHAALKKALTDRESRIIGFRPDPGKYRSFLASQNKNQK